MEEKKIPEQVKEAAKGLGTEIVFEHRKRGYNVYSVGMPCKEGEIMPPTGLPKLILFKDNTARIVVGDDSFDWI
ncbi:MAG: hypothetical protein IJK94_06625 [Bacteroidaceae bacterium]|nr:hypothetical protein [Bacteroidaceae bacterium]